MQKLFVGLILVSGLALTSPQLGRAEITNRFDIPLAGSFRTGDIQYLDPMSLVGEIPSEGLPASCQFGLPCYAYPYWTLSADLRDANCPGCRFPAFALPQTFDCLGDCTDGHWKVSNGIASAEMLPTAFVPIPEKSITGIRLEQDTTQAPVSCSQEYNLFVSKERVGPVRPYGPRLMHIVNFYQQIEEVVQGAECPAPLNLASTLIGVQLRHIATGNLFNFQVVSFDSRGAQFAASYWSFPNAHGNPVYGVVDSLEVFGIIPLKPGEEGRHILVDIAPRLNRHLRANPFGLDPNLANWEAFGLYGGSYTNGQAKIRSLLSFLP